jgi:hypothetical protein
MKIMAKSPETARFSHKSSQFAAAALMAFFIACAASCSFDYGAASLGDGMSDQTPNAELRDFEHCVVENGSVIFRLNAKQASTYETLKETRLTDVSFAEFDPQTGEALTSGKATDAKFFTATEDAEFSGDIEVYSKRNEVGLSGGYLYWNSKKKTLEGRRDRLISISKDDGSVIKGEGFSADAVKKSFAFSGHTSGIIKITDDEDAAE